MNRYAPTRVVTLVVTAVFDESESWNDEELIDLGVDALAAALPEGYNYAGSTGVVTSVSHAPER